MKNKPDYSKLTLVIIDSILMLILFLGFFIEYARFLSEEFSVLIFILVPIAFARMVVIIARHFEVYVKQYAKLLVFIIALTSVLIGSLITKF